MKIEKEYLEYKTVIIIIIYYKIKIYNKINRLQLEIFNITMKNYQILKKNYKYNKQIQIIMMTK